MVNSNVYGSPRMSKAGRVKARTRNVLLQGRPLGHSPHSTRTLPDTDFRYGQKNIMSGESAGDVISFYQTFDASRQSSFQPRAMITNIIRPTPSHASFGSASNHLLKPVIPHPLPSDKIQSYTYGVRSKPDTPAGLLMSDLFQKEWLAQRDRKILAKESRDGERRELHKANQHAAYEALVSVRERREAVANKARVDVSALFRLKQFENIPAKVITH